MLEDDDVRVLETVIAPGETTPVHTHPWPTVITILSSTHVVRRDADGTVLGDSRLHGAPPPVGTVVQSGPLGPHTVENVGEVDVRLLAVELKRPPTG